MGASQAMRLHLGVAMAPRGGRTAVVGAEVLERRDETGRLEHRFVIGLVERVNPTTVEAARDRLAELMTALESDRPCAFVDTGSAQGLALRQALRGAWSREIHRAHAYAGTGARSELFASFLQAYSTGHVTFRPGLAHRKELDRALVNYLGGGAAKSGVELSSEDEALVIAVGLALYWPRHGSRALPIGGEPARS